MTDKGVTSEADGLRLLWKRDGRGVKFKLVKAEVCDRCGARATSSVQCWLGCEHLQCARCARSTHQEAVDDGESALQRELRVARWLADDPFRLDG